MAAKKKSIKRQLKEAQKKTAGKGALMSKKEKEELLGMVKTSAKKKVAKKKK